MNAFGVAISARKLAAAQEALRVAHQTRQLETEQNAFRVAPNTKQLAAARDAKVIDEFLDGFTVNAMMTAVIHNLEKRTDYDPDRLEHYANQIGRLAHERARA